MSCCVSQSQTANATQSGDPTNTQQLRLAFRKEIRRRFRRVRGLIRQTVGYENDALRLSQSANAEPPDAFTFDSDQGRIEQFYRWLSQTLREVVLGPVEPARLRRGEHWTAEYIRRGYLVGWHQGTGLLFQQGASVTRRDDADILNLPIPQQQLQQLYTRTFEQLDGITNDAADTIRGELTRGLRDGWNPRKMARRLTKELRSLQHTRAETLARTELINSHSTATLDRYEDADVTVVSHGEWATADDDRVCAICQALEGGEFTTQEMRDTAFEMEGVSFSVRLRPPAHPNGRCVILPVVGGEPPSTPLSERLPDAPVQQAANGPAQEAANARVVV